MARCIGFDVFARDQVLPLGSKAARLKLGIEGRGDMSYLSRPDYLSCLPNAIQFCVVYGKCCLLIVDLTSHGQWHVFPVRRQTPCSGSLFGLGPILVLPFARVPLLKL